MSGQSDSLLFKFISEGAEKMLGNFTSVGNGAKHTAKTFGESADSIGNSAKKIARDFDVMGDESAEKMLKTVDAVGGLVGALGSGGLLAAVGAVAFAAAAYNAVMGHAEEQTKKVREAVKEYTEASRTLAEQIVKTQDASSKELDQQRRTVLETIRLNGLKMGALLSAYRLQNAIAAEQEKQAKGWDPFLNHAVNAAKAKDAVDFIEKEMTEFHRVNAELQAQATDLGKKEEVAKHKEAAKEREKITKAQVDAESKALQAALDRMLAADADEVVRRQKQQQAMDAQAEARARSRTGLQGEGNFDAVRSEYLQSLQFEMDLQTQLANAAVINANRVLASERSTGRQRIDAINQLAEVERQELLRRSAMVQADLNLKYEAGQITKTERDGLLAQDTLMTDALIANRNRERDATLAAMEEQRQAREANTAATVYAAQVDLAHAATMTVVQPVVAEFTGQLRALGDVNRDNFQEFMEFSDELPAIIAKKSQAIMAGIAAEAAGKAIFEIGEAAAMTAMGLGYLAIPGMQGQAGPAFMSAAQHAVAASVYGGIAGVAIGGAVAVGAMRGDGGLIPLTRAEKEEMARKEGKKGGSGDSMGGSSNATTDPGERVLNILIQNNAPIFGGDDTAAEMLAAPLARAARGYFGAAAQRGG